MLIVSRLIWDDWNIAHIARHKVFPDEVEQVCHNKPTTDRSYKGRLRIVGPTKTGRMITIILDPENKEGVCNVSPPFAPLGIIGHDKNYATKQTTAPVSMD